MSIAQSIYNKISLAFKPKLLEIIDESHKHAGHSGWRESGETHFKVILSSEPFVGMSRLERGRALTKLLDEEREKSLHAIEFEFRD